MMGAGHDDRRSGTPGQSRCPRNRVCRSGAAVAVADAEFSARFDAVACKDTPLHTLIVFNGAAGAHAVPRTLTADAWLKAFPTELAEADTHRNEMAFWMYSSGSTGRPKG